LVGSAPKIIIRPAILRVKLHRTKMRLRKSVTSAIFSTTTQ
jgi:hypothetical protein